MAEFLEFPSGSLVGAITSKPNVPQPPPGSPPLEGGTQLGDFGLSYDQALKRWLPVPRVWVAPDSKHYAYAYPGGAGILVVDVASGSVVELGAGKSWILIDVESTSVFADVPSTPGLWQLPFSGPPVEIQSSGYWEGIGGGAAYGDSVNEVLSSNTIQRLDLASGSIQPWFQFDGARSFVIGFDHAGAPIIKSLATDYLVWLVPAAGQAQVIEVSTETTFLNLVEPVGDKHGIWFDTTAGDLYLFVPGKGTYFMGATPAGGHIAGVCD